MKRALFLLLTLLFAALCGCKAAPPETVYLRDVCPENTEKVVIKGPYQTVELSAPEDWAWLMDIEYERLADEDQPDENEPAEPGAGVVSVYSYTPDGGEEARCELPSHKFGDDGWYRVNWYNDNGRWEKNSLAVINEKYGDVC